MEKVTAELRDSLIAKFSREALHLEMRDLYAAADHGRFRTWLAGEPRDPAARLRAKSGTCHDRPLRTGRASRGAGLRG